MARIILLKRWSGPNTPVHLPLLAFLSRVKSHSKCCWFRYLESGTIDQFAYQHWSVFVFMAAGTHVRRFNMLANIWTHFYASYGHVSDRPPYGTSFQACGKWYISEASVFARVESVFFWCIPMQYGTDYIPLLPQFSALRYGDPWQFITVTRYLSHRWLWMNRKHSLHRWIWPSWW